MGRVGRGHGEPSRPGSGRPPAPLQRGRRRDRESASCLTCPPSRPGLPGRSWGRGLGSRHVATQAGDAPSPGRLAHGRPASSPSLRAGAGSARDPMPRTRAPVPGAAEKGQKGEVAGAPNEVAFSRAARELPGSLRRDPDVEESRRAGARLLKSEELCLASCCSCQTEAGYHAPKVTPTASHPPTPRLGPCCLPGQRVSIPTGPRGPSHQTTQG